MWVLNRLIQALWWKIELDIHPRSAKWIGGSTSYSMVMAKEDLNELFALYSRLQMESVNRFQVKRTRCISKAIYKYFGSFIMDQNRPAPLEESTPGYYLLGMNIAVV